MGIPPGVDERDAKRPQTTVLGVPLLQIAYPADQLFTRDVLIVGQQVSLGSLAGVIDEDVGVGGHARNRTDHVAADTC